MVANNTNGSLSSCGCLRSADVFCTEQQEAPPKVLPQKQRSLLPTLQSLLHDLNTTEKQESNRFVSHLVASDQMPTRLNKTTGHH